MYYAQLNESSICIAVTQSAGPLVGPAFVQLAFFDTSVLAKKWDGSGWIAAPDPS